MASVVLSVLLLASERRRKERSSSPSVKSQCEASEQFLLVRVSAVSCLQWFDAVGCMIGKDCGV